MVLFKCKMCGGTLEIDNNGSVAICQYCGTKQTLPKLDDDRKANLYDRANHFRRNNEFDKAMGIYEQILSEDNTDAEAYWSLVLCRYGIEYVEDPETHKRIPTVNRAQFTSVYDDDNYKSALQYADGSQRVIYEEEAKTINDIQKRILEISQHEEAYDVFICYKETDDHDRRTPDSVLAQELYYQLNEEGFKVFFSRITLEDKLGSEFEPYIFSALNSAKVMVVIGTKPEFFNAVWVKNEWSRYLALIERGEKKVLIPAYKDMDPYDLPVEFSHLQAQDMSKLGFLQDLIRGIKKILEIDETKENVINDSGASTASLLKRTFMFLEEGDFNSANVYCEKVLDIDPENAQAYVGKLMSELQVRKQEYLNDCEQPFDDSNNYKKALRFGDDNLRSILQNYIEHIKTRNEQSRLEGIYNKACNIMNLAKYESSYRDAADLFNSISKYKDADVLAQKCLENAEVSRKNEILSAAKSKMMGVVASNYEEAIKLLESISGWKNADEQLSICKKKLAELQAKAEADRLKREQQAKLLSKEAGIRAKRDRMIAVIKVLTACAVIAFIILLINVIIPNSKYNNAVALMEAGRYQEAITAFEALDEYKDSAAKIDECYINMYGEEVYNKFKNINIGDIYTFGDYEQDNNSINGKEEIEWLVLAKEGSRILVLSKYALDCRQFNTTNDYVTWESCSLCTWLNDTFINNAFAAEEKAMIQTVTVSSDILGDNAISQGNSTQDKIFVLSDAEVDRYLTAESVKKCEPTTYAIANNAYVRNSNGMCMWWLRTCVNDNNCAIYVTYDGSNIKTGAQVDKDNIAVRPALWIDFAS